MSREAFEAIIDHSAVSKRDPLAKRVLEAIARHVHHQDGMTEWPEVWPGVRLLAELAGCDKGTVSRKVALLVKAGELAVRQEGHGRACRIYYRLLLPLPSPQTEARPYGAFCAGAADSAPDVTNGAPAPIPALAGGDTAVVQELARLTAVVGVLAERVQGLEQLLLERHGEATTPIADTLFDFADFAPVPAGLDGWADFALPTGADNPPHNVRTSSAMGAHADNNVGTMTADNTDNNGVIVRMPQRTTQTITGNNGQNGAVLSANADNNGRVLSAFAATMEEDADNTAVNVRIDQRGMQTIARPATSVTSSALLSANVRTVQSAMRTEDLKENKREESPISSLPSASPSLPPRQSKKQTPPAKAVDPEVQKTWSLLLTFLGEREIQGDKRNLSDEELAEMGRAVWQLQAHFRRESKIGLDFGSQQGRNTLRWKWWDALYDLLLESGWEVERCMRAMTFAIQELDKFKPGLITEPKSTLNKAKGWLASEARGAVTTPAAANGQEGEDVKALWHRLSTTAGKTGEWSKIFEQNPRAKKALQLASIQQSDVRQMSPRDMPFVQRRFEQEYANVTA